MPFGGIFLLGKEGVQETAQEAVTMTGVASAANASGKDAPYTATDVTDRLGNAFAGGAVMGGLFHAVGGTAGKINKVITYDDLNKLPDADLRVFNEDMTKVYADNLRKTTNFTDYQIRSYVNEAMKDTSREGTISRILNLQSELGQGNVASDVNMNTALNQKTSINTNKDMIEQGTNVTNQQKQIGDIISPSAENVNVNKLINEQTATNPTDTFNPKMTESSTVIDNFIQSNTQSKPLFTDKQLAEMTPLQLKTELLKLAPDYTKSMYGKISNHEGVDNYVDGLIEETDVVKLRDNLKEMQGELGYAEQIESNDDLNNGIENDTMQSNNQKNHSEEKLKLINNIKLHEWVSNIKAEDSGEIFDVLNQATVEELNYINKQSALIKGNFYEMGSGAYYDPNTQSISMNLLNVDDRAKAMGFTKAVGTFFHELGHLIDDMAYKNITGKRLIDELPELKNKLEKDALNYVNRLLAESEKDYQPVTSLDQLSNLQRLKVKKDLWVNPDMKNGVSDIFEALSNLTLKGKYGHQDILYWKRKNAIEKEAFAHMTEVMMIKGEKLKIFKTYFPVSFQYFYNLIIMLGVER